MQYFTNAESVKVYAESITFSNSKLKADDNIVIVIRFSDGSVGNFSYLANGDESMPKEYIEVFGAVEVIDIFLSGYIYSNNQKASLKQSGKGHKQEIEAFMTALNKGTEMPISFRSVCLTSHTTFRILDSYLPVYLNKLNLTYNECFKGIPGMD